MPKFEIEFEVQELRIAGLKVKVKGDREEIRVAQAIGQRIADILEPPISGIIDVEPGQRPQPLLPGIESNAESTNGKRKAARRKRSSIAPSPAAANGETQPQALNWKHDSSKWGSPQQKWNTAQKSLWLLFVAMNETEVKEMGSAVIAETFNKHFRQSSTILGHNISRDLGRLKKRTPPQISENTTKSPSAWFLTDAGTREAQKLVAAARGEGIAESRE